jgi:hypothetical protein
MKDFHVALCWLSLPFAFLIPEPDYWSYGFHQVHLSNGLIPNIPGC